MVRPRSRWYTNVECFTYLSHGIVIGGEDRSREALWVQRSTAAGSQHATTTGWGSRAGLMGTAEAPGTDRV
jgi:hypothetical protein